MSREWYVHGDDLYEVISKQIHSEFTRSRLMDFDEINSAKIAKTKDRVTLLFRKLKKKNDSFFWDLLLYCYLVALEEAGVTKYKSVQSIPPSVQDKLRRWLVVFLEGYDPVTKVVYNSEVDRQMSRMFEALIADKESGRRREVENDFSSAEKRWLRYVRQMFVEIEDGASVEGYKDAEVKKVRWVSERDSRVCNVCDKLDGQIFPIDEVPPKQHLNCRCHLEPV